MLELRIDGFQDIQRQLNTLSARQLPFALKEAVNKTAFAAQQESQRQLEAVFDKPTPMVKKATRVKKATKQDLTAVVSIDSRREVILKVHEIGSGRGKQPLERLLADKGWLPSGWRAVPTDNMPVDAYGNPNRRELKRIIKQLTDGGISGIRGERRRYFVVPPNVVHRFKPGVYCVQRNNTIITLYLFNSDVSYSPILNWRNAVYDEAVSVAPNCLSTAIQYAIDTSR